MYMKRGVWLGGRYGSMVWYGIDIECGFTGVMITMGILLFHEESLQVRFRTSRCVIVV